MKHTSLISLLLLGMACVGPLANAQDLPTITDKLLNTSGAVCIRISKSGAVSGSYLLVSTGDPEADRDMVHWAEQLHWLPAKPGEGLRDIWFPMPVAFGHGKPVVAPATCPPPQAE